MNPRLTGIPFSLRKMNKDEMAFHLALFEDNDLEQKLKDLSTVLIEYVKSGKEKESYELFHARAVQIFAGLENRVRLYIESGISESQYRQLLWLAVLEANEIQPDLPISTGFMQKQLRQIESAMLTRYTKNHFITDLWNKFGNRDTKKEAVTFESIYRAWADSKSTEEESIKQSLTIAAEDKKALQKTGIAGAGLLGFSGVVGLTGFAPYLLAAKLSAFIPLVNGPGLVSAVSVFSNPFISLGLLSMAGWRFYKKSGKE